MKDKKIPEIKSWRWLFKRYRSHYLIKLRGGFTFEEYISKKYPNGVIINKTTNETKK